MRKIYVVFVLLLCVGFKNVNAQSGIYETYAIMSLNGGANAYYDMLATTGNPDFNGANLGTYTVGVNSLAIKGGQNKVYKCGADDITSGELWYRIYEQSAVPGVFIGGTFLNEFVTNPGGTPGCGGVHQQWERTNSTVNVLSGLVPGAYYLEIYTTANFTPGPGTHFANNGGANYRASFTVACNPATLPSVAIADAPASPICAGINVTFTATPTNGGAAPTYQWKLNGANVGAGLATYSNATLANSDAVSVEMTSNDPLVCAGSLTVTSNTITETVNPLHAITLTSGSTTPTLCVNTLLATDIVYTIGGGATGAGVTGLPAGMVGTLSGNTYTISGTPTVAGSFPFTITTTGNGCTVATANGTITVNPNHTIVLTSGSTTPALCINTLLGTNIVYTIGAGATGAGVTGLPAGMAGNLSGTSFTISGTPTASGSFPYTVTTTGNACVVATATGTITVNSNHAISLTSGSSAPTLCINTTLATNIVYTIGAGATGVGVTGLPAGMAGNLSGTTFTISGTPTASGSFPYTVTTTGNACVAATATGTITVNSALAASVSITAVPAGAICAGTSVQFTPSPVNGGTPTYQWQVNGVNVATGATYTTTTLVNTDVVRVIMTSNATPCLTGSPATSAGITMTVNPNLPASVTIASSPTGIVLPGTNVTFTATPTNGGAAPTYQWKLNGTNVGAGLSTYSNATLTSGDIVTVIMTSNATPCLTGSPATSNAITPIGVVRLNSLANPTPTIYTTLKGAFDAVNAGTYTGTLAIEIYGNTTEAAAAVLNASGGASSYTALSIKPVGGIRTVTGAITTALVDLNGADNVTIDGLNTGGNSLTFSNTNTAATATVRLYADATNNIIRNCTILSAETSTTGGAIVLGAGTNGNDFNTITFNNIGPITAASSTPTNGIYSAGVATNFTDNVTISNNNIYDFYNTTGVSCGIFMPVNNSVWTISGNSFYQTVSRVGTANQHNGILTQTTNGVGATISNNYIGGNAPSCAGTWTVGLNAGITVSYRFVGMNLTFPSSPNGGTVQGNIITNFDVLTSSGAGTVNGNWCGILLAGGAATIGGATIPLGNTVGSSTGNPIKVSSSTTGGIAFGISVTSAANAGTINIQNNNIGGYNLVGITGTGSIATTAVSYGFIGINNVPNNNNTHTIDKNTVGSLITPNSITTPASTNAAGQPVLGIAFVGSTGTPTSASITNNNIYNLTNNYASNGTGTFFSQTKGILTANVLTTAISASTIPFTVTGNVINTLKTSSTYAGNNASSTLGGIQIMSTNGNIISQNTITGLSATATAVANHVYGIYVNASSTISKNIINSLSITSTTATAEMRGISANGGTCTISNNMVSLTGGVTVIGLYDALSTPSYYFNSVSISGVGVASSFSAALNKTNSNTNAIQNNIFSNTRTTAGTNYIFWSSVAMGASTLNYNAYYGSGLFTLARINATNYLTICALRPTYEVNGLFADPKFTSTNDLHLLATSPLEAKGIAAGGVTDDIDGTTRTTFDIGADEGAFTLTSFAVTATATSPSPICAGTNLVLSGAGTGPGGLTYGWTGPNSFTSAVQNPTIAAATIAATGTYILTVTDNVSGCITNTSNVAVVVNPALPASVTIAAAPAGAICTGTNVTFTATPTNGGAVPVYQWKLNGGNVGTNSDTYANNTLVNGDIVTVEMTSNASLCLTGSPATSAGITMVVNPNLPASVTIAALPAGAVCAGTSVTFTPTATNGGVSPTYQWKVNGANVATGATYTTSTLTNGQVVTVVMTSNATPCLTGSPATSAGITMVVNAPPTASISGTATICAGSSATLLVTLTGASPWDFDFNAIPSIGAPPPPGSVTGVVSSPYSLVVSPTVTTTYSIASLSSGGCFVSTGFVGSVTVTVIPGGSSSWTGAAADNNWNNAANWACGGIPTAGTNVIIPTSAPNYPIITTGAASANNVTIATGASVIVSGTGIFNLYGAISNAGSFNLTDGTLNITGTSPQTLAGTSITSARVKNLIIGNNVSLSSEVKIAGLLSFGTTGRTLTTNDNLTILSTSTAVDGTASVGNTTGNTIVGKASIERYLPAIKSWRFLATPVVTVAGGDATSPTITEAWREGQAVGTYTANGYGTRITGPDGGSGTPLMDEYTLRGSMKSYVASSSTFADISTLAQYSNRFANDEGYFVFVRGDRGITVPSGTTGATNLRMKGQIRTGNQIFSIPATKFFNSFGNPYPSRIDFRTVTKDPSISLSFYVWNPIAAGNYNVGKYEVYVRDAFPPNDYKLSVAPFTVKNFIESGEAVFIQDDGSGGTITVKETDKTTGSANVSRAGVTSPTLEISLHGKDASGNSYLADGVQLNFDNSFNNGLDKLDVKKVNNSFDNLSVKVNANVLAVERRKNLLSTDTIFLNLSNTRIAPYRFEIDPSVLSSTGLEAILEDKFLQTATPVSLTAVTNVAFDITSNVASKAADRFRIVFKQAPTVSFTTIAATRNADKTITVNWGVHNERNVSTYAVEHSNDGVNFSPLTAQTALANNGTNPTYSKLDVAATSASNWYRVKANIANAAAQYSGIAMVGALPADQLDKPSISINPNPVKDQTINIKFTNKVGDYNITLVNNEGRVVYSANIVIASPNVVKTIALGKAIAPGQYQLTMTNVDGKKEILSVLVL
jgi:hypothetical protein